MEATVTTANTALDACFTSTVYLALMIDETTEVTGGGYARQALTVGSAASGEVNNTAKISFGPSTESWGTVGRYHVYSALTGGTLLWQKVLSTSDAFAVGDDTIVTIAIGALTFTAE